MVADTASITREIALVLAARESTLLESGKNRGGAALRLPHILENAAVPVHC